MKRTSANSSKPKLKLSLTGVPTIPKDEAMSWEDWQAGRKQRRLTGMRTGPEIIRRESSSSDKRLRPLFKGERGLPITPINELPGADSR